MGSNDEPRAVSQVTDLVEIENMGKLKTSIKNGNETNHFQPVLV